MEVPVRQRRLRDNEALISPPIVAEPLYGCATAVTILSFLTHAKITAQVNGTTVVKTTAGFPDPGGQTFPLAAPLKPGDKVRARQKFGGATSGWSNVVTVRNHTVDFPTGPPRPRINPAPVYECGSRTGVDNLLIGCEVWITANGVEVGRVKGAGQHQGVNVNPDYGLNQTVLAWAELCNDPSPASAAWVTGPPPNPLPTPVVEPMYVGQQQIAINTLVNGARFTLTRNGINQGTFRTWGIRHLVGLGSPLNAGEVLGVTQRMCPGDPPSNPGKGTVQPCSALPAPTLAPIQDGDTTIALTSYVPGARIKVFVNGIKVGDSSGSVIALTQPIHDGDTVDVVQSVGSCRGQTAQEVSSHCIDPPTTYDPSDYDLYPVGNTDYDGGTIVLGGTNYAVKGTVYYPAQADGVGQPFNKRVAEHGRIPIVFMAHGNHSPASPSHLGYDYFQDQLASMGIIAASVYLNQTNGATGGAGNILLRAQLINASIQHFQSLDAGGDPIFGHKIDFKRVGLMGHSRGGEAVILAPTLPLPGVTVQAVLSLAPTDWGATNKHPSGFAYMTILPAADGDVIDNDGAKYYDGAQQFGFRSQVHVHHANHNYFNRQWLNDDTNGGLPLMPRPDHERVLSAYGCALYRAVLLGHNTVGFLNGRMLPAGVQTDNAKLSFQWPGQLIVDDYEGPGIATNSLGQPNTQSGLTANHYPFSQATPGRFNNSFFGQTTGMVAVPGGGAGTFRSQLAGNLNVTKKEIWIRVAEVYTGSIPAGAAGFKLGLEDFHGTTAWVDSDDVGGVPRPFDRKAYDLAQWYQTDKTKTMLKTIRFRTGCFHHKRKKRFQPNKIHAILIRLDRQDGRPLAFDDFEIVSK